VRISRVLAATLGALALVAGGAGAASAGEVTGSGKPTQGAAHARSVCAYSGLNDDRTAEEPGRTQSYGQIVRAGGKAFAPNPGVACNPTRGFEE
jgi:hypothetical protein